MESWLSNPSTTFKCVFDKWGCSKLARSGPDGCAGMSATIEYIARSALVSGHSFIEELVLTTCSAKDCLIFFCTFAQISLRSSLSLLVASPAPSWKISAASFGGVVASAKQADATKEISLVIHSLRKRLRTAVSIAAKKR